MRIRPFEPADASQCAALFYRAVHEGAAEKYSDAQRRAWAPAVPSAAAFAERLGDAATFVAEGPGAPDERAIEGFMSLFDYGYLDMAFVAPERRGTGLALRLYTAIEEHARGCGISRLTTHASLLAKPFFARRGWQVAEPESVGRDGVLIPRFLMVRHLSN